MTMSDSENQRAKWPDANIWGAMPSAEYVDNPHEGLDSCHLHRWLDPEVDGKYEMYFAFFAEKGEVEEAADYLNALEATITTLKAQLEAAEGKAVRYEAALREVHKWGILSDEPLATQIADHALSAPGQRPGSEEGNDADE